MNQIPDLTAFEHAFNVYSENPSRETARNLLKHTREFVKVRGRAATGPMIAIAEFAADNKHVRSPRGMCAFVWVAKLFTDPSRPAWNDYWMTRWMLRRDHESLIEIHRRAAHVVPTNANWEMVRFSAEWMVNSVKQTNPIFRYAMEIIEGRCPKCTGRPVAC